MKNQKIDENISENQKTKNNENENSNTASAINSIEEQLNLFAEIINDLIIIEQNEKKQTGN